jgi:hypothetical protein
LLHRFERHAEERLIRLNSRAGYVATSSVQQNINAPPRIHNFITGGTQLIRIQNISR